MSEKVVIPDSGLGKLGLRGESSKRTDSLPTSALSEFVWKEPLSGCQSQFAPIAEEETERLKSYAEVVDANGDQLMHRWFRKKRESDGEQEEHEGQTYAVRIQGLPEFGDRGTDGLKRRLPLGTRRRGENGNKTKVIIFGIRTDFSRIWPIRQWDCI